MNTKRMNETERDFVNACLERGARVVIDENEILVDNPNSDSPLNTTARVYAQAFDTPTRAAADTCKEVGL